MTQFLPPSLPHLGEKYFRRGKKIPKGFYRITVKAVVINKNGDILILKEGRFSDKNSEFYRNDAGLYDLPGGGLDWGEDFRIGLQREIEEEMGLEKKDIEIADAPIYIQISELDDRYHNDEDRDDFYPTLMIYYPVRLLSFDFHESPECTGFDWVNIDQYKKRPIWSHSASLGSIFHQEDFPINFIS